MNDINTILLALLVAAVGAIGYLIKRVLDKTDQIGADVADIKPKVYVLWADKFAPSYSPRQLNERGENVLNESGIKQIIDEKKVDLLKIIKEKNPQTAYDAEVCISKVTKEIPNLYPDTLLALKEGAFRAGVNVDTVLLVGYVYLRNIIFPDLGFSVGDVPEDEVDKE